MYTHIYIYISSNWFRIACTYRYTKLNLGRGMVGPTLSNEIFKSDNPTEPPSHEPSFHSVISSLRGVDIPGDVASIGSAEPRLIGPTGLKGISKTLRTSLFSPSLPEMFLSQQVRDVRMDLFFLLLFSQRREKGVERWGAFVHWKSLLRLSTVDTIGMVFGAFLYLIWWCSM